MHHTQLMAMVCQLTAGCYIPRRGFLSLFHDSVTLLPGCIRTPQPWGPGLCSDSDPRIGTQREICNSEQLQDSMRVSDGQVVEGKERQGVSDRDKHNSERSTSRMQSSDTIRASAPTIPTRNSPPWGMQAPHGMLQSWRGCARVGNLFLDQPPTPLRIPWGAEAFGWGVRISRTCRKTFRIKPSSRSSIWQRFLGLLTKVCRHPVGKDPCQVLLPQP